MLFRFLLPKSFYKEIENKCMNYAHETELINKFETFSVLPFTEQCNLFIRLFQSINEKTVLQIHAFLISSETLIIKLPKDSITHLKKLQENVINQTLKLTPFPNLKTEGMRFKEKLQKNNKTDLDARFRDLLIETFNSLEKDHIIFEVERALEDINTENFPFIEKLILDCASKKINLKPKFLTVFIEPKHISINLLQKMAEFPEFCEDFFISLFLHQKEKYDLITEKIFNLNFRLSPNIMNAMINIKFENMPVYNFEVFSYFISYQPKIKQQILEKCQTLKKTVLLNLVTAHFDFFKKNFEMFNLSFNDLIYCAKTQPNILYFLISEPAFLETFNFQTFIILVQNLDEGIISEFFTKIIVDQKSLNTGKRREILEEVFLIFMKEGKKVNDGIQSLLTSTFLDSEKYFLSLIDFIWKPIILSYQENYLTKEENLNIFLRQLSPVDILHKIHEYKNLEKAVLASKLCFKRREIFNSEVLIQTILLLEQNLPILTMRTVLFTLMNYKFTFNQINDFLIRIRKKIFERKENIIGFEKCLLFMKENCLEIILNLNFDELKIIFRNYELRKMVEKILVNKRGEKKYEEIFYALRK